MEYPDIPLRLAGVIRESIVDGPGIRLVVFVQGCPHHCKGCHNPATHDPAGGYDGNGDRILREVDKNPLLSGVTFSGGEPFEQAEPLSRLAQQIHARDKNVVTYTGYTMEHLLSRLSERPDWEALLRGTDILVDGPFILEQKDMLLKFRGSRNQRVLSPVQSLKQGRAVEIPWSPYDKV
ncbi:MAG: anaerobic ribonucleoside-triphosphate reductase activating protein [Clostridiales bacterium]|nr:anaerobic ribonucleoside-triphosphate reductase activating protein [Clostridiales bacterium]